MRQLAGLTALALITTALPRHAHADVPQSVVLPAPAGVTKPKSNTPPATVHSKRSADKDTERAKYKRQLETPDRELEQLLTRHKIKPYRPEDYARPDLRQWQYPSDWSAKRRQLFLAREIRESDRIQQLKERDQSRRLLEETVRKAGQPAATGK